MRGKIYGPVYPSLFGITDLVSTLAVLVTDWERGRPRKDNICVGFILYYWI